MSEEIRKKIEEYAKKATEYYNDYGVSDPEWHFKDGAEFGYQLAQDHFKKFTLLKSEPTVTTDGTTPIESNQDELWEEFENECGYLDLEKAKKRYRITRI